ncbi:MAG: hypothetical protein RIR00_1402 [Pseudomonadota bacterium]|jgi:cell division protein FtsN
MSRDLKPKRTPPAKKARGGTLIGMFIGLVLGVGVAAGVVWYMNRSTLPFTKPAQPATPPAAAAAGTTPANAAGGKVQGQPAEPMALPGKPGDPVPEKRFQFYDILPGKADATPAGKPPESKPATPPVPVAKAEDKKPEEAKPEEKKPVVLQAGSFSKPEDADNQKAKLAMFGQEAVVQQVMIGDKVLYRVRLGPFAKPEEANKLKAELSKAGIDVSPVK